MALFNLIARLGLNASGYELGLKRAQSQTQAFGNSIDRNIKGRLAAAFGVGSVVFGLQRLIRSTIESANRIKDLSDQFSISTDEVQRLDIAARKTGLSFDDFGTALSKIGAARKDAAQGNQDMRRAFSDFGIVLDDVNDSGIENIEILKRMGQALAGQEANPRLLQNLREMFGRSGGRLFEALKNIEQFNQGEKIFNTEDLRKIDEAGEKIDTILRKLKVPTAAILGALTTTVGPLQRQRGQSAAAPSALAGPPTPEEIALGLSQPAGAIAARRRGPPIAEDEVEIKRINELIKARQQLWETIAKVKFDQLTNSEKEAALQQRINDQLFVASHLREDEKQFVEAMTRAEELRGQLFDLRRGGGRGAGRQADELLQRGGFTGGGNVNRAEQNAQQMIQLLRSIDNKTPIPGLGANGVSF